MTKKSIRWNGKLWTINSATGYFRNGNQNLHREKWVALRGPIAPGMIIHHKDHNKSNNAISNLECLTNAEHARHHFTGRVRSKEEIAKMKQSRLHTQKQSTLKMVATKLANPPCFSQQCKYCAKAFKSKSSLSKWCSKQCESDAYRLRKRKCL